MNADRGGAQARQFARQSTRRPARIEVHPDHAEQFRLSFPEGQSEMFVTDISRGGLGLISGVYVPRNLRLRLHICPPDTNRPASGTDVSVAVVCRRCSLADHRPTYLVGLQYVEPDDRDVQALIASVAAADIPEAPA